MSRTTGTTASKADSRSTSSVRDRILDTAADLFYREGVRGVGVDLIVERSGVAKTSLYRHFATKDELVAAFLEKENTRYWNEWDNIASRHQDNALAELEAHLESIAQHIAQTKYRGCPFLNVVVEFPKPDHPARAVAASHKSELRRRLGALVTGMGATMPTSLIDQLVLLIDGAYVNGQLPGKNQPSLALTAAALILVAAGGRQSGRQGR